MVKGYNIVIEASEAVANRARSVSDLLASKMDTGFILDTTKHVPHVTLYHVSLEETQVPSVLVALSQVVSAVEPFSLYQASYRLIDGRWVDRGYEREDPIVRLHNLVLERVAEFRAHEAGTEQKEEWSDRSPERQENLELYGASEVRGLYQPHLTLTRLVEKTDESILEGLPEVDLSFTATAIALYELGEYGTCHSVLGVFPFTNETL